MEIEVMAILLMFAAMLVLSVLLVRAIRSGRPIVTGLTASTLALAGYLFATSLAAFVADVNAAKGPGSPDGVVAADGTGC